MVNCGQFVQSWTSRLPVHLTLAIVLVGANMRAGVAGKNNMTGGLRGNLQ